MFIVMTKNTMYKQIGNGLFVLSGKYVDLYNQIQAKTKSFVKDINEGKISFKK